MSAPHRQKHRCFGVLAEFPNGDALLGAIRHAKSAGFTKLEAYTPLPIHEVAEDVDSQFDGYPVVESEGDEDAWGLTGRE